MPFLIGDLNYEIELLSWNWFSLYWFIIETKQGKCRNFRRRVLDYDDDGHIAGIDIDNARHKIDLNEIILNKVPAQLQSITA